MVKTFHGILHTCAKTAGFSMAVNSDMVLQNHLPRRNCFMQNEEIGILLQKAKERNPDAFAELMQLHMKDMYRVALAILMNDEDAADAIQDTLLACWKKIGSLKHDKYFRTWMTRKC